MKILSTKSLFKFILSLALTIIFTTYIQAQVGIGTNSPHSSAQLHVQSQNKGFLPPYMSAAQRNAIPSPAPGLIVYQTDGDKGLYIRETDGWKKLIVEDDPIGFSATKNSLTASGTTTLKGFTVQKNNGNGFNATEGTFTAPKKGIYRVSAVVNYKTTATITANLGAGTQPYLVIRKTQPTTSDLLKSYFNVVNVNILLVVNLNVILGSGNVTVTGDIELEQGETVALVFEPGGLNINLDLGANVDKGINWSIWKVR